MSGLLTADSAALLQDLSPAEPTGGDATSSEGSAADREIQRHVRLALASAVPQCQVTERRREQRHPFPYPVYLTPLGDDGRPRTDETVVVIGKHLSDHGLDFYHVEPLPHRRVIASLPTGEGRWVGLLLELSWCRFGRHGYYDNGGRFLGAVSSPLAG